MVGPRDVLNGMGVHAARVRLLARGDNRHWLVDTPDGRVVLRRYGADRSMAAVTYELRLLEHLDRRGWPVPAAVAPAVETGGAVWCAFRYVPGRAPAPRSAAGVQAEQRQRGRLLAKLHVEMADLAVIGQRDGWRRADEGLKERTGRPPVDEVLAGYERESPDEGRVLRAYAERTRERLKALLPHAPAPVAIHGDLTPWNIRYTRGTLSGVLDFDLAHLDLRVADFALSWRGQYDEVLRGYEEVSPLKPVERELVTPVYWAWMIGSAVAGLDAGEGGAEWAVRHLLRTKDPAFDLRTTPLRSTARSTRGG